MASGVPGEDGIPELISMWVSPAGRGKGIGDRLVQAVAQWARLQGAAALRLGVGKTTSRRPLCTGATDLPALVS
jgi:GNAT superfamily N-acetyltransferase